MRKWCTLTFGAALFAAGAVPAETQETPEAAHRPPEGGVARAAFTRAIRDREPVDRIAVLPASETEIYYFTELRRLGGHTILHRWRHDGKVMAEVAFKVGGPRWRVYSRKTLLPSQLGRWSVEVVDQASGWPLRVDYFEYVPAAAPAGEAVTGGSAGAEGSRNASPARADSAPEPGAAAASGPAAGTAADGTSEPDALGDAGAGSGPAEGEDAPAGGRAETAESPASSAGP